MKTELFIAKRLLFNKDKGKKTSSPAVRIAIVSMALGLAVMILAVCIVIGFKQEVANKIIGFGSHIQITNVRAVSSYETHGIAIEDAFLDELKQHPNIEHIDRFSIKPGMIKTENDFMGIVIKGIDENYDWTFFQNNLIEGNILTISPDSTTNNVLVSKEIADKLHLKLYDSFPTYFVQGSGRARRFHISGIYETNFSDYDKMFVLSDIKQVQRLNDWEKDMVGGLEIRLKDYDKLEETEMQLYYQLLNRTDYLGNAYYVRSIREINPMIFEWLDVLDLNAVVILILMMVVAGFSMISALLIIILERANMIGILKALGQTNAGIRRVFLYLSISLIGRGLLWGNLIGLAICLIQKYTGIFMLDPQVYYLTEVPVHINWLYILLINLGALFVTLFMLIGPSYLIAKLSPSKTIRFE